MTLNRRKPDEQKERSSVALLAINFQEVRREVHRDFAFKKIADGRNCVITSVNFSIEPLVGSLYSQNLLNHI